MPRRGRTPIRSIGAAACLLVASVAGLGAASATSLGGVTAARLTARTVAGASGAPTVRVWENFTGTAGSNLVGTTTEGGTAGTRTWAVNPTGGTWAVSSDRATSTTVDTSLVVNAGAFAVTSVVTVYRNGTTFDGGLTINRNAGGTQFLACEWTSNGTGQVEIWKYDGQWVLMAQATNLYPGGPTTAPASVVLGCGSGATGVTATLDGVVVTTAAFTAAERSRFQRAANQLTGPYQYLATGMTFDDFHVDSP